MVPEFTTAPGGPKNSTPTSVPVISPAAAALARFETRPPAPIKTPTPMLPVPATVPKFTIVPAPLKDSTPVLRAVIDPLDAPLVPFET